MNSIFSLFGRGIEQQEHRIGKHGLFVREWRPQHVRFPYPIVCIHGAFAGVGTWRIIAPYLARRGFRCVTFALRGHAKSKRINLSGVSCDDYVQDIAEVIATLKLDDPMLIGHSMGGTLALQYAAAYDVRGIIAIDPTIPAEVPVSRLPAWRLKYIPDVPMFRELGVPDEWELAKQFVSDMPRRYMHAFRRALHFTESGHALQELAQGVSVPPDKLHNIPILILAAEMRKSMVVDIPLADVKALAEQYGAEFTVIDSTTHVGIVLGIHARETARRIIEWLIHTNKRDLR